MESQRYTFEKATEFEIRFVIFFVGELINEQYFSIWLCCMLDRRPNPWLDIQKLRCKSYFWRQANSTGQHSNLFTMPKLPYKLCWSVEQLVSIKTIQSCLLQILCAHSGLVDMLYVFSKMCRAFHKTHGVCVFIRERTKKGLSPMPTRLQTKTER